MTVDGATKRMDLSHLRSTLKRAASAITYVQDYVKQKKATPALAEWQAQLKALAEIATQGLPGQAAQEQAGMLGKLAKKP
eukprot:6957975-Alexandrium_andersonii.AAC.1